ncbi:MAG: hypothetical protein ACYC6F_14955 [Longimicrobiales bacterium]
MTGDFDPNGGGTPVHGPSGDGQGGRRLPPPAFPPGSRKPAAQRPGATSDDLSSAMILPDDPIPERTGEVPEGAFMSPDDPIRRMAAQSDDDAFISPDEPIQRRAPLTGTITRADLDLDEVVVTGIGDDAHMEADELALGFDPHVLEVVDTVGRLAEALKRKGEAGLKATPEMSRFEATLRSYVVGYLAGRRAADEEG